LQHADVNVNKVLIGNKCDMQERVVSQQEGEALAEEYDVKFFETSAKQDFRVEDSFQAIANDVKDRLMADGAASGPHGHKLNSAPAAAPAKSGCC
jgi:Ras-related protein Rab-8A